MTIKEYQVELLTKRADEVETILSALSKGNTVDALYAIYTNKEDETVFIPILMRYFKSERTKVKKQIKALKSNE